MIAIWGFAPAIAEPGVFVLPVGHPLVLAPEQPGTPNEPGQAPSVPGTPATPQPVDPTEGGSVGPAIPGVPLGAPQKNPDPGIEQHPHKGPGLPPVVPEIPSNG